MQREEQEIKPSFWNRLGSSTLAFLPDFTEHPKPKRRKSLEKQQEEAPELPSDDDTEVVFFHDFVAGGVAGSASVIVGHPFDTIKVRIQTSSSGSAMTSMREFGGLSSLFRGMGAPLSAAAIINAIVFGSYGVASRLWDDYIPLPANWQAEHDPWQKAMTCGSFAGLVQCVVICPMEHVKCRLQVQHGKGTADHKYKGPIQAVRRIYREYGWPKLYQGWWATVWREVPAFGLYFCAYDYLKDKANAFFAARGTLPHHTWLSSAFAGGFSGCITWGIVYSVDVIKTQIQTMPLDTPAQDLKMWRVASDLVAQHGWKHLFRGLGITLIRAFPVNGTIFPVYEFTLMQVCQWEKRQQQQS